ncbi:hypothetical protein FOB58_005369 [Candida parapsilosis]|uniref:Uncharacterized protein n=1 Tax=Candida parapsilosis TaxID=5480 RepID=A0A8X7NGK6_CANPA|nr:hypothetical protein FOB58_005369 [Candida parapsilosis]KAF6043849.1 hypothetical protein FOB59_004805 [Candida parapsilosis]KAF6045531.1 hypothetical protein FOB60_005103 [Candida parapsilosis]KAF6060318.1 hypothetical protein FOB61_005333 [Candida parapsilosis]KAI5905565.1 hypothetical protein K4G60_g4825 [Candida parapsilosis]
MFNRAVSEDDSCLWSQTLSSKEPNIIKFDTSKWRKLSKNQGDSVGFLFDIGAGDYDVTIPGHTGVRNYSVEDVGNNAAEQGRQNDRLQLVDLKDDDDNGYDTIENEIFGLGDLERATNEANTPHNHFEMATSPTFELPFGVDNVFESIERRQQDNALAHYSATSSQRFIDLKNRHEVSIFTRQRYGNNYNGFDEDTYHPIKNNPKGRKREAWKESFQAIGSVFKNRLKQKQSVTKLVPRSSVTNQEEIDAETQLLVDHFAGVCTPAEVLEGVQLRSSVPVMLSRLGLMDAGV